MRETGRSGFKSHLIRELRHMFPGCFIIHNDPNVNFQGIPDLLVLYKDRWAMLECKASAKARKQPNQDYYIEKFDGLSFGAFIYPENAEDVLNDLQHAFESGRTARVSQR